MKKTIKFIATALLGVSAIANVAYASEAYYANEKPVSLTAKKAGQYFSRVTLKNYTNDEYTSQATFYDSKKFISLALGPWRSGRDKINYDIDPYTDNRVCLYVFRNFDHAVVLDDQCYYSSVNVNIGNPRMAKGKPEVTVTH